MSHIISEQIFSWGIYAVTLFFICLLTIKHLPKIGKFAMQGVIGVSFILIINCVLFKFNLCLGINAFTVLVSSILGIPGIGLMYILLYVF